jgi:hypothetical protein
MSLFCLLWLPLFYLFWVSVSPGNSGSGAVLALLLGSITAVLQLFWGSLIEPRGFGFSRWAAILVDIVAFPAVLPLIICIPFTALRVLSGRPDWTNFALLWLIPGAVIRAVSWSALQNPSLLILTPLLWTAIAVGIPFLAGIIMEERLVPLIVCLALAILGLPLLAATGYWAFFSQKQLTGALLLSLTALPLGIDLIRSYYRACKNR